MDVKKKVAVIGQGYVGLPLSISLINSGYEVFGIDIDEALIANLGQGISHIEDVKNSDLIRCLNTQRYSPTSNFEEVSQCSVIVICVPTPLDAERKPDLSSLKSAVESVASYTNAKTLVINESTSYPGTLRDVIIPLFPKEIRDTLHFAIAPERINPGDSEFNLQKITRVVSGMTTESIAYVKEFYESINASVYVVSKPEVAEYAKMLENAFRFINIGFINELAILTTSSGVDIFEVIDAASSKPFGFLPFYPGIGVGGHCIPVDPIYLKFYAEQKNQSLDSVSIAENKNDSMIEFAANRIKSLSGKNSKLVFYGVAYKAGLKDLRESPSILLRSKLKLEGFEVGFIDDLVEQVNDFSVINLESNYDLMIYVHGRNRLEEFISSNKIKKILDCSGTLTEGEKVYSLFSLR